MAHITPTERRELLAADRQRRLGQARIDERVEREGTQRSKLELPPRVATRVWIEARKEVGLEINPEIIDKTFRDKVEAAIKEADQGAHALLGDNFGFTNKIKPKKQRRVEQQPASHHYEMLPHGCPECNGCVRISRAHKRTTCTECGTLVFPGFEMVVNTPVDNAAPKEVQSPIPVRSRAARVSSDGKPFQHVALRPRNSDDRRKLPEDDAQRIRLGLLIRQYPHATLRYLSRWAQGKVQPNLQAFPRSDGYSANGVCLSCGAPKEERTPGCDHCQLRHFQRQKAAEAKVTTVEVKPDVFEMLATGPWWAEV